MKIGKTRFFKKPKISAFLLFLEKRKIADKVVQGIPNRPQTVAEWIGGVKLAGLADQKYRNKDCETP